MNFVLAVEGADGFVSVTPSESAAASGSCGSMTQQRISETLLSGGGYRSCIADDSYQVLEQQMIGNSLLVCKADGCKRQVYFDPTFREFEYCSPECRDKNLLQGWQYQLEFDLEELKKELRELAVVEMSISNKSSNVKSKSPSIVARAPRTISQKSPDSTPKLGKDCMIVLFV